MLSLDPARWRTAVLDAFDSLAADHFGCFEPTRAARHLLDEPPTDAGALVQQLSNAPPKESVATTVALVRALRLHGGGTSREIRSLNVSPCAEEAPPGLFFHHGDLDIDGNLSIDEGAWFVCTGDVRVTGSIYDYEPGALLLTGGDLTATSMSTMGEVIVDGSLHLTETLFAHRNDCALLVRGDIDAATLVRYDHNIKCGGKLQIESRFDARKDEDLATLHQLLVDGIVTPDEEDEDSFTFDSDACDRILRAGRSVLRTLG